MRLPIACLLCLAGAIAFTIILPPLASFAACIVWGGFCGWMAIE